MRCKEIVPGYVLTVSDLLSPRECAALVAGAETDGFDRAPIDGHDGPILDLQRRDAFRWIGERVHLADALWKRLATYVPSELDSDVAAGLNPRLRIYRYDRGQRFAPHTDRPIEVDGLASRLSVIVYLNEDFRGGVTRFRRLRVPPRMGTAVLFRHELEHEATPVLSGTRYVLRTDVMYRPAHRAVAASRRWPTGWTTGRYV